MTKLDKSTLSEQIKWVKSRISEDDMFKEVLHSLEMFKNRYAEKSESYVVEMDTNTYRKWITEK